MGLVLSFIILYVVSVLAPSSSWDTLVLLGLSVLLGFSYAWGEWRHATVPLVAVVPLLLLLDAIGFYSTVITAAALFGLALFTWGFVWGERFGQWAEPRLKGGQALLWVPLLLAAIPGYVLRQLIPGAQDRPAHQVLSAPMDGAGLYVLTLVVEGLCALVRSFLLYLPLLVVLIPLHVLVFLTTRDNYLTQVATLLE